MNDYTVNYFLWRCDDTKTLLDEFKTVLPTWKENPPSEEALLSWVERFDKLGMQEWLDIGGIDDLRKDVLKASTNQGGEL